MSVPLLTLCLVLSATQQCLAQAADTSAIDFSLAGGAAVDPETGAVCVEREEEVERVEQLSEQQCTQQTVSQVKDFSHKQGIMYPRHVCQCYNSYNTQYRDVVREECREVCTSNSVIISSEHSAAGVHQDLQDRDEGEVLQPQLQGVQEAPRQAVRRACESAAS